MLILKHKSPIPLKSFPLPARRLASRPHGCRYLEPSLSYISRMSPVLTRCFQPMHPNERSPVTQALITVLEVLPVLNLTFNVLSKS